MSEKHYEEAFTENRSLCRRIILHLSSMCSFLVIAVCLCYWLSVLVLCYFLSMPSRIKLKYNEKEK